MTEDSDRGVGNRKILFLVCSIECFFSYTNKYFIILYNRVCMLTKNKLKLTNFGFGPLSARPSFLLNVI